jgi:hypothetical protein
MDRKRRILITVAGVLAAAATSAGPAAASHGGGGGGGGGGTPTQPTDFLSICADRWDTVSYTDGSSPVINRTLGGCVGVRHYPTGVNVLDFVDLQPGWTYTIESNGAGSNSRVQLSLSNATTGQKAQIRVENGKTVIS